MCAFQDKILIVTTRNVWLWDEKTMRRLTIHEQEMQAN